MGTTCPTPLHCFLATLNWEKPMRQTSGRSLAAFVATLAATLTIPLAADAEQRVGLAVDHIEVTREFLAFLDVPMATGASSLRISSIQAFFIQEALHQSRRGRVYSRPKETYSKRQPLQIRRPTEPPPRPPPLHSSGSSSSSSPNKPWSVRDADLGFDGTLTPTNFFPELVHLTLRLEGEARVRQVMATARQTAAILLESDDVRCRLLLVTPWIVPMDHK